MATNPSNVPTSRLKLDVHTTEDATVVRLSGKLTRDDAATFKEQVKGLIPQTKRLVLDLSDVAYMDSSGLGAVVERVRLRQESRLRPSVDQLVQARPGTARNDKLALRLRNHRPVFCQDGVRESEAVGSKRQA